MKVKKSDWTLIREAEKDGLMVAMTSIVERNRTDLNKELSQYFKEKVPGYMPNFNEDDGEEVLYGINEYLKKSNIDKKPLDFPISSGTDIHLIPVTDNLQLKVLVEDEYYGDGDYSKGVLIDFFLINENTNKEDVDALINFIEEYIS